MTGESMISRSPNAILHINNVEREREYIFSPGAVHFKLFTNKLVNFWPNEVNERANLYSCT